MRIIGFNLTKISIQRKEEIQGKLNINQNIDIKDIKEDNIPISQDKALKINFNFSINYSDNLAKLEFEGSVLTLPNKEELKEILDSWKSKKIPDQARMGLFNFIMNKCNIKALQLEDEMTLPLHVPMPRIGAQQQPQDQQTNQESE